MKNWGNERRFHIPTRRAFVNITTEVEECPRESGISEGLVLVNALPIAASVFINDDESGLLHDSQVWLENLAPPRTGLPVPPQGGRKQRRRPPQAADPGP